MHILKVGKTHFHKAQAFKYVKDEPLLVGSKPGIGGKPLPGQSTAKNSSVYPKGLGGDKPAWVAFDRQVRMIHIKIDFIISECCCFAGAAFLRLFPRGSPREARGTVQSTQECHIVLSGG